MRASVALACLLTACTAEEGPDPAPPAVASAGPAAETASSAPGASLSQPMARIVPLGPDDPDDGIVTREEAERAARTPRPPAPIIQPGPDPVTRRPTRAEIFAGDCVEHEERWTRLQSRYGPIGGRGATARIDRLRWDGMPEDDRRSILWGLAYRASCPARRPGTFMVRVLDLESRLLRRQSVSTTLECQGDRIGGGPDSTWYLC